jgi:hypothetical protein
MVRGILDLWAKDSLSLKLIDPTPVGVQTNILRFTMEIFVYKWLLLVSIIIIIITSTKTIITPEFVNVIFYYLFPWYVDPKAFIVLYR